MKKNKQELIHEYSKSIKRLKEECLDAGINEEEFKQLYLESLESVELKQMPKNSDGYRKRIWKLTIVFSGLILISVAAYSFKYLYSCIVCNFQDYIYPGLKLLRRISIPIISLFPALTEYYQETCLVQNPFFTVVDMDCWPCSSIYDVKELDDVGTTQHNVPFVYKTNQEVISVEILEDLYLKHNDILRKEIPKIFTNNKYYLYPDDFFERWKAGENSLNIWKFNTMNEAKVLRQKIFRPKIVPKFGQSTERFIIIDTNQETFKVPDTECSFSFLIALNGSRTVNLVPAEECKHQCRSLQIELKQTYLLWYNWWYWRPRIQSTTRNGTFIAHIGSYC